MKIHNIARVSCHRAFSRYGRARMFFVQFLKPPRGRPFGGGGVYRYYTKNIFKYYLNNHVFIGKTSVT
jgi:hypothetical protein